MSSSLRYSVREHILYMLNIVALAAVLHIMATSVEGKTVVVIGGGSGISLSAAILTVRKGAHIVLVGRDEKKLAEAAKSIILHRFRCFKPGFTQATLTDIYQPLYFNG